MSDQPTVYEIDVTKKYILLIEGHMSSQEISRVHDYIRKWVDDPKEPFLILNSNAVKLVKVSDGSQKET